MVVAGVTSILIRPSPPVNHLNRGGRGTWPANLFIYFYIGKLVDKSL